MNADFALSIGGAGPIPRGALRSLRLELASDAPDRLWVQTRRAAMAIVPSVGVAAALQLGPLSFDGRIASTVERSPDGAEPVVALEVESRWASRARALETAEELREITDSEAVARLADALGLSAGIAQSRHVHSTLRRIGSPTGFILERARALGWTAAFGRGRVQFGPAIENAPFREIARAPGTRILAIGQGERGRFGRLALSTLPRVAPLDRLRLTRFGSRADGTYRVARVEAALDERSVRAEVLFVEDDRDLARLDLLDGVLSREEAA